MEKKHNIRNVKTLVSDKEIFIYFLRLNNKITIQFSLLDKYKVNVHF